jgi:hypothetical protein
MKKNQKKKLNHPENPKVRRKMKRKTKMMMMVHQD